MPLLPSERAFLRKSGVTDIDAPADDLGLDRAFSILVDTVVPARIEVRSDERGAKWMAWWLVTVEDGGITGGPTKLGRAARKNVLSRFIELDGADDEAYLRFARTFGVLDLCACGQPSRSREHARGAGCQAPLVVVRSSTSNTPSAAPLEAWRARTRQAHAIVMALAHLRKARGTGYRGKPTIPFCGRRLSPDEIMSLAAPRQRSEGAVGSDLSHWLDLVDAVNADWLDPADIRLRCALLDWMEPIGTTPAEWIARRDAAGGTAKALRDAVRTSRVMRDLDVGGLFGFLARQLAEIIAASPGQIACSFCGRLYSPKGTRAPRTDGKWFSCGRPDCAKAHGRARQRDSRRARAAAPGRSARNTPRAN